MTKGKQGKIALAVVKAMARRGGIDKLLENLRRLNEDHAAATSLTVEELKAFGELIAHELIEEDFASQAK